MMKWKYIIKLRDHNYYKDKYITIEEEGDYCIWNDDLGSYDEFGEIWT